MTSSISKPPIPTVKRIFNVNGRPFFPLGGQTCNSSGYNDLESATAFQAVKALDGNTLEIPVYWEQIEPQEGDFDFTPVAALLTNARQHDLHLILLWFGTWKNGDMDYVPGWIKTNPQRFHRALTPSGKSTWVLSSHCSANLAADCKAFTALCEYLKENDQAEQTVIAIQVENEPGILGSDRDYGPDGQADFLSQVPDNLVAQIMSAGQGSIFEIWQKAGAQETGSWPDLFGWAAGELMTAWSIASYIDTVAAAGKAVYPLPMYINVWLGEGGWAIPGESYPSGGAVSKTLDIYKWFTPHIDLIAPDIYIGDTQGYESTLVAYTRPDNPLFIPESSPSGSNAWLMFRALTDYNAIGYAFFAVEHILDADGSIRIEYRQVVDSMRCVAAVIPLLLQFQGSGQIHAIVQEENQGTQRLLLDGWLGLVTFAVSQDDGMPRDWRHLPGRGMRPTGERGRGLVFQVNQNEFYLVGGHYRLFLRLLLPPEQALDATVAREQLLPRQAPYVRVDEGYFTSTGVYSVTRQRNGDEVDGGVWVEPDCGVVRVILARQ